MTFTVNGNPQGKARARTFYNQKLGHMQSITPAGTKSYEDLIRFEYGRAGGKYNGKVPMSVAVLAVYPIPKSKPKKIQAAMREGEIYPTVKPDGDNVLKSVLDGLNRVAWADDSCVVDIHIRKTYGDEPCLKIEVEPI